MQSLSLCLIMLRCTLKIGAAAALSLAVVVDLESHDPSLKVYHRASAEQIRQRTWEMILCPNTYLLCFFPVFFLYFVSVV